MKNYDEVWAYIYFVAALFAAFYFATHIGQPIDPNLSEEEYRNQVTYLILSPITFVFFSAMGIAVLKCKHQSK